MCKDPGRLARFACFESPASKVTVHPPIQWADRTMTGRMSLKLL
jgi:hypothetical protein